MIQIFFSFLFYLFIDFLLFSYPDAVSFDEEIGEWAVKWNEVQEDEEKKLEHMETFFRMHLSDDVTMYYYSFCWKDFNEDSCQWHCLICKKCDDWREWHCGYCNKCKTIIYQENSFESLVLFS